MEGMWDLPNWGRTFEKTLTQQQERKNESRENFAYQYQLALLVLLIMCVVSSFRGRAKTVLQDRNVKQLTILAFLPLTFWLVSSLQKKSTLQKLVILFHNVYKFGQINRSVPKDFSYACGGILMVLGLGCTECFIKRWCDMGHTARFEQSICY